MKYSNIILYVFIILIAYISYIDISSIVPDSNLSYGVGRAMVIIELIALIYFLFNFNILTRISKIMYYISLFWIVCLFSILLRANHNSFITNIGIISNITYWFSAFLFGYIYVKRNPSNYDTSVNLIIILLFPILALVYFKTAFIVNSFKPISYSGLNKSYYLLLMLPFILLLKKSKIQTILISVIALSVIISFKRAGLIAFSISIITYYYSLWRSKKNVTNYHNIVLLIPILIIILIYYYTEMNTGGLLSNRMENMIVDGGSGRTIIWAEVINLQFQSDIISWIYGHGYDAVSFASPLAMSSHNDFLEILYDYGCIAFIIYLLAINSLKNIYIKMYKIKIYTSIPFLVSCILFAILSFFSHLIIYPSYFILLTYFWGITIARYENDQSYRLLNLQSEYCHIHKSTKYYLRWQNNN